MRTKPERQANEGCKMTDNETAGAVRIRGIYTTALTQLCLQNGWSVVDASSPIKRRFDADFETTAHDITISTTDDRTGVGIDGTPAAVEAASDLISSVGIDTFVWEDPTPSGGIFDGQVTETLGSGAVVDLGKREGFLPFRVVEGRLEDGDMVRIQVREAAAPWVSDRPLLGTDLEVGGRLLTLRPGSGEQTVDSRDEAAARELLGMLELLEIKAPEGWRIRWQHAATEASMDDLQAALERAAERVDTLSAELGGEAKGGITAAGDSPGLLAARSASTWAWFGRSSRFELDAIRREVTTTMTGHHRIKAGSAEASAGVDFVEALCEPADEEFPFETVADVFGPTEGESVEIGHGKPAGHYISLGSGTVTDRDDESVRLRRTLSGGGSYDGLGVPREAGDTATTTFREGRWWYPTVYRDSDGSVKGTYVNICTPLECFPETVRYVDLHVDVLKHADGRIERVDDEELAAAVETGYISKRLAQKARSVASALENAL